MKPTPAHPYPRVGTGVFIVKGGKVLFGLRHSAHGEGTWAPPGGKLKLGETWEDCVRREVMEETDLYIKDIRFLTVTNDIHKHEGLHFVTLFFVCTWESGEPMVTEPDKCERWDWVSWDNLPSPRFLAIEHFLQTGINPTAASQQM